MESDQGNNTLIPRGDFKSVLKISNEDLGTSLSKDKDFRALSDMISFFEQMPNKTNFVANFKKETLEAQKNDDYFISLSGYTQQDVADAKAKVLNHTEHLFLKYPQLKDYSETELYSVIEKASDLYDATSNINGKVKCSTCAKIGRTKMLFYTATGAAICGAAGGPFALYTGWFCATTGFALAGYEALACLEDCQK